MITSKQAFSFFGTPDVKMERKHMVLWDVPEDINLAIPALPNKIYCNKLLVKHLEAAFRCIIKNGLAKEIKTWDGCFNIRKIKGSSSWSLHSWGLGIDINASWNRLGNKPTMNMKVVKCFTDNNFYWGGNFSRKDGMHFELNINL